MGIIYKITSPSGKLYVGKTYDLRKRINAHKCSIKKGKNIILHNSIRKYGWDAHVLEIIEEVEDSLMDEREMFWVSELKTYCYENKNGLNMTKGGDGQRSTWMHDIERRKWYSNKFKESGSPFYRRKHTTESKMIISQKAKERNSSTGGRKEPIRMCVVNLNGDKLFEFNSQREMAQLMHVSSERIRKTINTNEIFYSKYRIISI